MLLFPSVIPAMKREAPAGEPEQEAKVARVVYPANLGLQDLPDELLKIIIKNLAVAKGPSEKARLYKAAESIRSLLMTSPFFTKYLNDIEFNGALILELARRYTNNNIVEAALALATQAGGAWLTRIILAEPQNVQKDDRRDALVLMLQAITQGQEGVVNFLLYNYPNLMDTVEIAYDPDGDTFLIAAIRKNLFNIIKLLIDAGVDVNKTSRPPAEGFPGSSPLSQALGHDPRILDLLLEAGADVNAGGWYDNGDETEEFFVPIVAAIREGDRYAFNKLLADENIDLNFQVSGRAPLIHAIKELDIASMEALLAAGADPNIINADPDELEHDTRTPLLYTTRNINPARNEDLKQMAELLLEYGANVNLTTEGNFTPLMLASLDRPDLVPLFIKAGANVNAQDSYGQTPLTLAVRSGKLDVVEQLIKAGADVTHTTENGDTIFDLASDLQDGPIKDAIIKLLEERRAQLP